MEDAEAIEILRFHRFLLGETNVRLERFRGAIERQIAPGNAVVDLGSGTGILAFYACLAGARRVYAIEAAPVIELAKVVARANGFEDRIVFLQGTSHEVALPERVDAIVTDTFGLWRSNGLWSIADARDRFLQPGGVIIPSAVELFAAPIEIPDLYEHHVEFWNQPHGGVDFSAIHPFAPHHCYPISVQADRMMGGAISVARLDCSETKTFGFAGEGVAVAERRGTIHGLCVWFASHLAEGLVVSNQPGATTTNYAQGFFPLRRPAAVDEGDRIEMDIRSFDSLEWRWHVRVARQGSSNPPETDERFDQSTFWGFPWSAGTLRKLAPQSAPVLSQRGHAERFLLERTDGTRSIAQLEIELLDRYPDVFTSRQDAAAFVAAVVNRCA
jgi:protein arginine N-methyltransferase 1